MLAIPYIKTNFCWLPDISVKYICEHSNVGNYLKLGLLPFCWRNPYGFRVNQMEGILFRIWQVSTLQFFTKLWYAYAEKVDIYETFAEQNVILAKKQIDYGLGLVFLYCAKFPRRMNCREIISGKTDWLFLVSLTSCQCLPLKDPHTQILVFSYLDFSLSPSNYPISLQLCPFQAVRFAY